LANCLDIPKPMAKKEKIRSRTYLLGGFLLLLLINFLSFQLIPFSPLERDRQQALLSPGVETLLAFSRRLIARGEWSYSQKEIQRAKTILGKTSSKEEYQSWQETEHRRRIVDPGEIKKWIAFWKRVVVKDPLYPDAWAQLAIYWFRLGRVEFARMAIAKAIRLDPIRGEFKEVQREMVTNQQPQRPTSRFFSF
jgi:cytochrome c-type biogenesis protein CcmH/NrfG